MSDLLIQVVNLALLKSHVLHRFILKLCKCFIYFLRVTLDLAIHDCDKTLHRLLFELVNFGDEFSETCVGVLLLVGANYAGNEELLFEVKHGLVKVLLLCLTVSFHLS